MSDDGSLASGKEKQIKIGTCIRGAHLLEDLRNAVFMGFDTVELYYNDTLSGADFDVLIPQTRDVIGESGVTISGIGLYCNPLANERAKQELAYCIQKARGLGTDFVGTKPSGCAIDRSDCTAKKILAEGISCSWEGCFR